MPWQVLILVHSVIGGYRTILTRRIGLVRHDVSFYALAVSFTCVWVTGLVVAYYNSTSLDNEAAWNLKGFIILGGLLFGTANLLSLKLFRMVTASVAVLLSLLNVLAVVLVAAIFGGERLSPVQIIGGLFLLSAVFIAEIMNFMSKKQSRKIKQLKISKSLVLTIVLSIIFAFGVVNEKYLLSHLPLTTYLVYGWGAQFLTAIILFVSFSKGRNVRLYTKNTHVIVWKSGALLAAGGLLFVISLSESRSSSLATLASSAKVVTAMLFAYYLLHERDGMLLKFASVGLSCVGLVLLLG